MSSRERLALQTYGNNPAMFTIPYALLKIECIQYRQLQAGDIVTCFFVRHKDAHDCSFICYRLCYANADNSGPAWDIGNVMVLLRFILHTFTWDFQICCGGKVFNFTKRFRKICYDLNQNQELHLYDNIFVQKFTCGLFYKYITKHGDLSKSNLEGGIHFSTLNVSLFILVAEPFAEILKFNRCRVLFIFTFSIFLWLLRICPARNKHKCKRFTTNSDHLFVCTAHYRHQMFAFISWISCNMINEMMVII